MWFLNVGNVVEWSIIWYIDVSSLGSQYICTHIDALFFSFTETVMHKALGDMVYYTAEKT